MATLLAKELSDSERIQLAQLFSHPGFRVLEKLFTDMCNTATEKVIKLDPLKTEDFEKKVAQLQIQARITNDICSSILASAEWHIREITTKQALAQQEAAESKKVVNMKPLFAPKVSSTIE